MSSTLQMPEPVSEQQPAPLSFLMDRLPEWSRLPRVAAGFVALLGAAFWVFSYQPLYHTDLWGHLAYGKLLWETGTFPATEPFMVLAQGVPLVDTAWLSQLIGYLAEAKWGLAALQFLQAAMITTCFSMLTIGVYRRT